MVSKWQVSAGDVLTELTSADIPASLSVIREQGIELRNVEAVDDLTVSFYVQNKDMKRLSNLLNRRGDTLRILQRGGIVWRLRAFLHRPILTGGLAILLFLTLWLPGKVLFVQVKGNRDIPDKRIIEEAANCGVSFGSPTAEIRSENIKNALLSALPQLQWAGVNTYGCVAVITVQERQMPEKGDGASVVSSIVSSCDGVILSVTAEEGTALCSPGDSVLAGQTLISGYTDCRICIRAGQAKGDVFALTRRSLSILSPDDYEKRGEQLDSNRKLALILGKKRINFYKCSGILPPTCARIYSALYVTLPGGFTLPVCLLSEQWVTYEESDAVVPSGTDVTESARQYLQSILLAGEILQCAEDISYEDGLALLSGEYICKEQIGITRIEETLDQLWEK